MQQDTAYHIDSQHGRKSRKLLYRRSRMIEEIEQLYPENTHTFAVIPGGMDQYASGVLVVGGPRLYWHDGNGVQSVKFEQLGYAELVSDGHYARLELTSEIGPLYFRLGDLRFGGGATQEVRMFVEQILRSINAWRGDD